MKKVHELCLKMNLDLGHISDKDFDRISTESTTESGSSVAAGGAIAEQTGVA